MKEETGLDLDDDRFIFMETLNCKRLDYNYHSISLVMFSQINENEKTMIKNMEPNKCEKWIWVSISQLRNNLSKLFYPLQDFFNKHSLLKSMDQLKERIMSRWNKERKYLNNSNEMISNDDKGDVISIDSDSTYEEENFIKDYSKECYTI